MCKIYNSEIKEEFIKYYEQTYNSSSNVATLERIFKATKSHEDILHKDIANFTLQEIFDLLPIFESKSAESLQVRVSLLRTYTEWFIRKGLSIDFQNHFTEVQFSDLKKYVYKNNRFIDPDTLEEIVRSLNNASDKVVVKGVYEGLTLEEVANLTKDQVDLDKGVITLPFKTISISYDLKNAIRNSLQETEYYSYRSANVTYQTKPLPEVESNLVVKRLIGRRNTNLPGNVGDEKAIGRRLLKIKDYSGYENLGYINLRNSGFVQSILTLAMKEGTQDIIELSKKDSFASLLKIYGMTKQEGYYYNALVRKILGDDWETKFFKNS